MITFVSHRDPSTTQSVVLEEQFVKSTRTHLKMVCLSKKLMNEPGRYLFQNPDCPLPTSLQPCDQMIILWLQIIRTRSPHVIILTFLEMVFFSRQTKENSKYPSSFLKLLIFTLKQILIWIILNFVFNANRVKIFPHQIFPHFWYFDLIPNGMYVDQHLEFHMNLI